MTFRDLEAEYILAALDGSPHTVVVEVAAEIHVTEVVIVEVQPEPPEPTRLPRWRQNALEMVSAGIQRYTLSLSEILARDANEGDTRLLVTDLLCEALGYDKYRDLSTEFMVSGERADYGVKVDGELTWFLEVKRVGHRLRIADLRQVETYAVKHGVEWGALTNGTTWQLYNIRSSVGRPVETTLVASVDLLDPDVDMTAKVETLALLHHSYIKRDVISAARDAVRALSVEVLRDAMLSEDVVKMLRHEVYRSTGTRVPVENLRDAVAEHFC